LNNIIPDSIKIEIKNATVDLGHISVSNANTFKNVTNKDIQSKITFNKHNQDSIKIDKINSFIKKKGQIWVAGETPISKLTYDQKKKYYRDVIPIIYGIEYYRGGIFEIPGSSTRSVAKTTTSTVVESFDWRNRHGQNWLSPVRLQIGPTCNEYAAVGTVEGLVNLYYNQHLDLNLSEQDVLACAYLPLGYVGATLENALIYCAATGVVDDYCFPMVDGTFETLCEEKCENPTEKIKITDIQIFNTSSYEDPVTELKKFIIQYGIIAGRIADWNHAMALVGYGTIKENDIIWDGYDPNGRVNTPITIQANDNRIGETYWIFKNSGGASWGLSGYCQVIADIEQFENSVIAITPVTSLNYTESDIVCEDLDGDSYFNWGIGDKPSTCPSNSLNLKDGDDSNSSLGPLDLDYYGNCVSICPPIIINSNTTWNTNRNLCGGIIINSGTLTINSSSTVNMEVYSFIIIKAGGGLLINGGKIINANIISSSGSNFTIQNNGYIKISLVGDFINNLGTSYNHLGGTIE
jgi:hypothetical protein